MRRDEIETPALLIDLDAMERNLAKMAAWFAGRPARLRPHAKTHKTPILAHKQIAAGAIGITCAKLGEAEVMVQAGIRDVLIANQVVGASKIERLAHLARHAELMVAVDDPQNIADLSAACMAAGSRLRVLVEVDVGMGRCGARTIEGAVALAKLVAEARGLELAGVMGYEGHLVQKLDPEERGAGVRQAMGRLLEARAEIERAGLPCAIVSGGGTGTYDLTGSTPGVTEVQAGSYLTMDATYKKVRPEFECALTLLCTVVSRPTPNLVFTDAGHKAITSEMGLAQPKELPGARVFGLAEEHGKIELEDPSLPLRPGDRVEIVPTHGCTTINLHDRFYAMRGDVVEAIWPIAARGKCQ